MTIMPLFISRSNDYTEFKKCTRCNPVVTDSYDSLDTTTIGMCFDGQLCMNKISYLTTKIVLCICQTVVSKYELSELVSGYHCIILKYVFKWQRNCCPYLKVFFD